MTRNPSPPLTEEDDKPLTDPYETGCWLVFAAAVLILAIALLGLYLISPNVAYLKGTP